MLRRNVDTGDRLVNGAIGTVTSLQLQGGRCVAIHVLFDDPTVGRNRRMALQGEAAGLHSPIAVERATSVFAPLGRGGRFQLQREQYPLALAHAITVHRTQGLGMDEAVLDLGHRLFAEGQAYVALSRVRSLEGVALLALDEHKVCNVPREPLAYYQRLGFVPLDCEAAPPPLAPAEAAPAGEQAQQGAVEAPPPQQQQPAQPAGQPPGRPRGRQGRGAGLQARTRGADGGAAPPQRHAPRRLPSPSSSRAGPACTARMCSSCCGTSPAGPAPSARRWPRRPRQSSGQGCCSASSARGRCPIGGRRGQGRRGRRGRLGATALAGPCWRVPRANVQLVLCAAVCSRARAGSPVPRLSRQRAACQRLASAHPSCPGRRRPVPHLGCSRRPSPADIHPRRHSAGHGGRALCCRRDAGCRNRAAWQRPGRAGCPPA